MDKRESGDIAGGDGDNEKAAGSLDWSLEEVGGWLWREHWRRLGRREWFQSEVWRSPQVMLKKIG